MRKRSATAILGVVLACALAVALGADGGRLIVLVGAHELPTAQVLSIEVDSDAATVDGARVIFETGSSNVPRVGDDMSVEGAGVSARIFNGEIVGVEPSFGTGSRSQVIVRALNRLHRLTRGRKSRTFENLSDAEIVGQLAQEAGLAPKSSGPEVTIKHDHVFQHNQTDLEFLFERASLIGYEVFVDDTTLNFRRRLDPPLIALGCAPTRNLSQVQLKLFHPRLASASQVSKVTVRGWDPERREEIAALATRRMIPLSDAGGRLIDPPGTLLDLGFVPALETGQASYGSAAGTLSAVTALDVSGEADSDGSAALRVGARVSIQGADQPFNGEYYVRKVSHRFDMGSDEGWHTLLRVTRADRAIYVLPEIGDEALIAFEHGDIRQPVVVGSLWDGERVPAEESGCQRH